MKVAMHQSQYIPWPPYFKKIASADLFILMDCVQYQKNGVQNRNKIRDKQQDFWLTIPVTGNLSDTIAQKPLAGDAWREKHWKSLKGAYQKAPQWGRHGAALESLYAAPAATLGEVNDRFLKYMLEAAGVKTPVKKLSELAVDGAKTDLVVAAVKKAGGDAYLSGTGAKDYMDENAFKDAGIAVEYKEAKPPEYRQFHGEPAIPGLSMLDMLLNCEPAAVSAYLGAA